MPAQQDDYYSFNSPCLCRWYAYIQLFYSTSYLNSFQIMYVFSVCIDSLDQVDSKEVINVSQINYMHFQNIYVQPITKLTGKIKSIFKIFSKDYVSLPYHAQTNFGIVNICLFQLNLTLCYIQNNLENLLDLYRNCAAVAEDENSHFDSCWIKILRNRQHINCRELSKLIGLIMALLTM